MGLGISSLAVWAENLDNRWRIHKPAVELAGEKINLYQPNLKNSKTAFASCLSIYCNVFFVALYLIVLKTTQMNCVKFSLTGIQSWTQQRIDSRQDGRFKVLWCSILQGKKIKWWYVNWSRKNSWNNWSIHCWPQRLRQSDCFRCKFIDLDASL